MGSSKDYIALPADEKLLNSTNSPPPPYEDKPARSPLHWKVICLLLTLVGLVIIGLSIHPNGKHAQSVQVDLGFPQDTQQHNQAQEALTDFMTRIVYEARQDHHSHHHHRKHHNHYHPKLINHKGHNHHHSHHHPHADKSDHPFQQPPQAEHHHRHGHHHQKHEKDNAEYIQHLPTHNRYHPPTKHLNQRRENDNDEYVQKLPTHNHYQPPTKHLNQRREDGETEYIQKLPTHNRYQPPTKLLNQRREDDETEYIQKLPTHNRYQPPTKHLNRRREQTATLTEGNQQQPWIQSYRFTPSTKTSLHIRSAHVRSSLIGDVMLRQDTTGTQHDIVITFRTNAIDGVIPVELSTKTYGDSFFVRTHSTHHHHDTSTDYSIDIVLPSSMTSMKNLNIHLNNGTIHADPSIHATFDAVKFSVNYGAMSIQKLAADRILLGIYSGVLSGTFQPKDRFAVGVYYGHSNVRLLQSPTKPDHCRHLHIAASSPHGGSEITLERGAFEGQFLAYGTLEVAPKMNFTSNDKQLYEYQVVNQQDSGWFMKNSVSSQLMIHGRDGTTLTFE